jgi:ATP-binding cassette subfamily B protein
MSSNPQTLREVLPRLDRIVRRFAPLVAKHRRLAAGSVAALIFSTLLKLLEPWPLKIVFDRVLYGTNARLARWKFIPGIDQLSGSRLLLVAAVALVVVTALRAGGEYFTSVWFATIGNRVLREVRDQLYRHLQRLSLSFHTTARTGDLTVRVISDVNMLRDVAVTAVLPLLANVLVLAGMWTVRFMIAVYHEAPSPVNLAYDKGRYHAKDSGQGQRSAVMNDMLRGARAFSL